jgi:hypothetical protein
VNEVGQNASAYPVLDVMNGHIPCMLPTERICVFCKQHYLDSPCNGDVLCSL